MPIVARSISTNISYVICDFSSYNNVLNMIYDISVLITQQFQITQHQNINQTKNI